MKRKALFKDIVKGLVVTLVFFAAVEALLRIAYFARNSIVTYVPLVYALGDKYLVPPWLDGFRILEEDETLIWKNRPNVRRRYVDVFSPSHTDEERRSLERRFLPSLPDSLNRNPKWKIFLNSEGFRTAEFAKAKPTATFRIVCLGDSWTFGSNADQNKSYPQQLMALLNRDFPQANFEVLNLGVLGYSSYQGLQLLKQRALDLNPDFVVLGFAMNDSNVAGYHDKDMPGYNQSVTATKRVVGLLQKSEIYKLSRYMAMALKEKPKSIGEQMKSNAHAEEGGAIPDRSMSESQLYEQLEPWTRVPLNDYEKNLVEMIELARARKAGVVLLFNELWRDNPYRIVLEKISKARGVPLVDSSALIAERRRRIEQDLEKKLGLVPAEESGVSSNGEVEVVFRLYVKDYPVPRAIYIVGNHPKLGSFAPNKIALHDDGTHGDQRAGDHVWSYSATFPPGTRLFYMYTNSGVEGKWEGIDVPSVRSFKVEANAEKKLYMPIDTFGKIYLVADNWHTNAAGYEMIAGDLFDILKRNRKVVDYLRRVNQTYSRPFS